MLPNHLLRTSLFVLAAIGAALLASRTRLAQFAELRVPEGSFTETYVQMDAGATRCVVTDRTGTTQKRSERGVPKPKWDCRLAGGEEEPVGLVAVDGKRPSYLFVPFTRVSDLVYPLAFEALRGADDLPIPAIAWTSFYLNRQYQGLHLKIELPGRLFATKNDLGEVELLALSEGALLCLDRKLRPTCPVYTDLIASGVFPQPRRSEALDFLDALLTRAGQRSRAYMLSNQRGAILEPFPVPVALGELLAPSSPRYSDARYRSWQLDPRSELPALDLPWLELPPAAEIERYLARLGSSIEASCRIMACDSASQLQRVASSRSLAAMQNSSAPERESHAGAY
jgi:hypothetical protein